MPRLTDTSIRNAQPGERDKWIKDSSYTGLYLRVRAAGSKVFVLRLKRGGKVQVRTLGAWPAYSLRQAHLEATKAAARRSGHVTRITVRDAMGEFWDHHVAPKYKRTASPLTYRNEIERVLGKRPADDVRPGEVSEMVRAYKARGPVAANRLLAFTKLAFSWMVEAGYVSADPCASLSNRIAGGEERSRERVLTDEEIRALWASRSPHSNLLRCLLLTGCRIGELQAAERRNLKGDRLHIPETKNGKPHWVHITPDARQQFEPKGDYLFGTRSNTAVQAWVKRFQRLAPSVWTPHDLRRTFVSQGGAIGIQPHVLRALINHTEEGSLPIYLRSDYAEERIAATKAIAARIVAVARGAA